MRTIFRQVIALILLALLPAAATAFFHPKKPSWRSDEVTPAVAQSWGDKVLWIDARPLHDYVREHFPSALPLNEDAWNDLLPAVLDAWSPQRVIVVYCSSLSCQTSREVASRLRGEVALPQVFVLSGGWEALQKTLPKNAAQNDSQNDAQKK